MFDFSSFSTTFIYMYMHKSINVIFVNCQINFREYVQYWKSLTVANIYISFPIHSNTVCLTFKRTIHGLLKAYYKKRKKTY